MNLLETLKKQKQGKDGDIVKFILDKVDEIALQKFDEFKEKLLQEFTQKLLEQSNDSIQTIKEIKKGDPGEPGLKGKDYILTEADKVKIASLIDVPVVKQIVKEKTIVEKQPIVTEKITNEVKEVAKYETAEQIADKLNTKDEIIERKVIKGLEIYLKNLERGLKEKIGQKKGGGGDIVKAGTNIAITNVNGVKTITLDIPIQPTAPIDPVDGQLWIDNS